MKYFVLFLMIASRLSWAVDNPEAPNYVAEFESRISVYEDYISNKAMTTADYSKGYADLFSALDKELNSAYSQLMKNLSEPEKELLKVSQRHWIKYRDAEYDFIGEAITREKFGSSAVMSIGAYRTSLVKSRVTELLWYLNKHS